MPKYNSTTERWCERFRSANYWSWYSENVCHICMHTVCVCVCARLGRAMPCHVSWLLHHSSNVNFIRFGGFFFSSFAFCSNGVIDIIQFECWKYHLINSPYCSCSCSCLVLWSSCYFFGKCLIKSIIIFVGLSLRLMKKKN